MKGGGGTRSTTLAECEILLIRLVSSLFPVSLCHGLSALHDVKLLGVACTVAVLPGKVGPKCVHTHVLLVDARGYRERSYGSTKGEREHVVLQKVRENSWFFSFVLAHIPSRLKPLAFADVF